MDAVLLREAGGLGDILQVGAAATLLHRAGYVVHFYILPDPALMEMAGLIRSIDYVHPLRMSIKDRRARGVKTYRRLRYLGPVLAHALGTTNFGASRGPRKNKFFDMFCQAWAAELGDASEGRAPKFSRAQSFVLAAGFTPSVAAPPKLRSTDHVSGLIDQVHKRLGKKYTVLAPWAKDSCRSMSKGVPELLDAITKEVGPVVVVDYGSPSAGEHYVLKKNVMWYSRDFHGQIDRSIAVHHVVELIKNSIGVVGVESGPVHIAASLNKPVALICGPTLSSVALRHYSRVVGCDSKTMPPSRSCAGCYYHRARGFTPGCREHGCRVIGTITPEDVVSGLKEVCGCESLSV